MSVKLRRCDRAAKFSCKRLREAALAAAICNFDRIPLLDLAVLSFQDYLEVISSNHLPSQQVPQKACTPLRQKRAHFPSKAFLHNLTRTKEFGCKAD